MDATGWGRRCVLVLGCVIWWLVPQGEVLAQEASADETPPAAQAVAVRGEVKVQSPDGPWRDLGTDQDVLVGDTVRTGDDGRVRLRFRDQTLIALGPGTVLRVQAFAFDPTRNEAELRTHVSKGVFRVVGGLIVEMAPERLVTQTPTASIGVRGSEYMAEVSILGVRVVFLGGKAIVIWNEGGTLEIDTPNLQALITDSASMPAEPTPAVLDEIARILLRIEGGLGTVPGDDEDDGAGGPGDDDDDDGQGDDDDDDDDDRSGGGGAPAAEGIYDEIREDLLRTEETGEDSPA
jgi:hypothetical protein